MNDVMKKLGIAKGTIYHYFNSKESLLEAVVEKTVDEYLSMMQKLLDETKGAALERMKVLITSGRVGPANDPILEQLHRPGNVGMHTRQLAVAMLGLAPLYANVIQQGCDEGVFHTDYPLECAEFLLSGIQFLSDIGVHPWTQADLKRRALSFPALIEAQLQAPKGSFRFLAEHITGEE